jgi:uncharacterized protein YbjT (DUF2867 family)
LVRGTLHKFPKLNKEVKDMILITGATGNVGREIVKQMHGSGHQIRVVSRNPAKVLWPADVEIIKGDLSDPEVAKAALNGVKKVFLVLLPGGDNISQLVEHYGIDHIVFLSASAIDVKPENAIGRAHLRAEEQIRQSGVPWTFLRPGAFMSNVLQWSDSIRTERIVRAPFGDVGTNLIDPRDIAATAVNALLSSGHEGKIYTLSGPEVLSAREQTQILSDVLGEHIEFEDIPQAIAMENMKRFAPSEFVDAMFQLMREGTIPSTTSSIKIDDLIGQPARTFKMWATDNANKFQ